jgi:hypothetical protein
MLPDVINLVTPKHTGTNSVADLLCQSPDVAERWASLNWALWQGHHHLHGAEKRSQVFHHHVGLHPCSFNDRERHPWYRSLVHDAILPWMLEETHGPLITTMRDPLGSIVTSRRRRPEQPTDWIVDSFLTIRDLHQLRGVEPFCIDKHSKQDILKLFERAEVRPPRGPALRRVETTAPGLRPHLHVAYRMCDMEFLMDKLGEDIEYLQERESLLRPWMEKLGYEDLLWWS